jgi:hypothetical protein
VLGSNADMIYQAGQRLKLSSRVQERYAVGTITLTNSIQKSWDGGRGREITGHELELFDASGKLLDRFESRSRR